LLLPRKKKIGIFVIFLSLLCVTMSSFRKIMQEELSLKAEINLYYDIYFPDEMSGKLPLLIAVHGYGASKRYMMTEAKRIANGKFVIVSIQAPYQHYRESKGAFKVGFGWLTDYKSEESVVVHQKFILDILAKLSSVESIDTSRVFLFGFSQACALNFRFAFTYPEKLTAVIGVCGGIPSDLETNADYKTLESDVFYLYSQNDEFYPIEKFEGFNEKLKARLPNYSSKSYAAKHEIIDEMREDMKNWLQKF
jgi:predicted esterase